MYPTNILRRYLPYVALVGALTFSARSATARPEAPGQLQEAADMKCVPLCTMCHQTNPGDKTNWNKPLGAALRTPISSQQDIKPAYDAWAALNPQLAALVKNGQEPGTGQDVCGPTYGCAVRIEKEAAAPRDFGGPLLVVGAMVVGGLVRRRRRAAK